ncbi:MAG: Transcriptional regulatory protein ZraR [Planctomycetota bacterium]
MGQSLPTTRHPSGDREEAFESPHLLIVDDDPTVSRSLADFCAARDWKATTARTADDALLAIDAADAGDHPVDIVLSDVSLPGMDGFELLGRLTRERKGVAVILMTGYGSIDSAVAALRSGAADYLTRPIVEVELLQAVARAMRQRSLLRENRSLRMRAAAGDLGHIVGSDPRMIRVFEIIRAVSPGRTTVLMSGESGTGKSMIAHAIHSLSTRRDKPYVELSCGSIPETLLESELFGHVKGAFTGAHADKAGRFLAANGGTIFLDEINSASPGMQLKLLRVLQERKFEPVGSTQTIEVDVRVVLASNQPLETLVATGQFRQDLYYRINVVKIELPPLRERAADIPGLAMHFLDKHAAELRRQIIGFSPEVMRLLERYAFPGNIRELSNIVERAAVLCRGQTIVAEDLPPHVLETPPPRAAPSPSSGPDSSAATWTACTLDEALREPERRILTAALEANQWNRQKTAEVLGINRTTLYKKMKALGIDAAPE